LLHEVVHRAVFNGPRPAAERALAILYAVPSGISSLQFTRWHLTHHAELGDSEADPKRHYLSPRINKAWYKLLYFTPALFPIYFRAARRETATYPPALQRRIAWERRGTIAFHLAVMAVIFLLAGGGLLACVQLEPCFEPREVRLESFDFGFLRFDAAMLPLELVQEQRIQELIPDRLGPTLVVVDDHLRIDLRHLFRDQAVFFEPDRVDLRLVPES